LAGLLASHLVRENIVFWEEPQGRSMLISNATNPLKESQRESVLGRILCLVRIRILRAISTSLLLIEVSLVESTEIFLSNILINCRWRGLYLKTLIERNPPPWGGFLLYMFPDQDPCVTDFTTRCDRREISYTRLLIREHSN